MTLDTAREEIFRLRQTLATLSNQLATRRNKHEIPSSLGGWLGSSYTAPFPTHPQKTPSPRASWGSDLGLDGRYAPLPYPLQSLSEHLPPSFSAPVSYPPPPPPPSSSASAYDLFAPPTLHFAPTSSQPTCPNFYYRYYSEGAGKQELWQPAPSQRGAQDVVEGDKLGYAGEWQIAPMIPEEYIQVYSYIINKCGSGHVATGVMGGGQ